MYAIVAVVSLQPPCSPGSTRRTHRLLEMRRHRRRAIEASRLRHFETLGTSTYYSIHIRRKVPCSSKEHGDVLSRLHASSLWLTAPNGALMFSSCLPPLCIGFFAVLFIAFVSTSLREGIIPRGHRFQLHGWGISCIESLARYDSLVTVIMNSSNSKTHSPFSLVIQLLGLLATGARHVRSNRLDCLTEPGRFTCGCAPIVALLLPMTRGGSPFGGSSGGTGSEPPGSSLRTDF